MLDSGVVYQNIDRFELPGSTCNNCNLFSITFSSKRKELASSEREYGSAKIVCQAFKDQTLLFQRG
jgi:hypothetical protein